MKLASVFTDHMVFQAGKPIRIFGSGCGTVSVTFLGKTVEKVCGDEKWCLELPAGDYGGGYDMTVSLNGEAVTLRDVYVGEVLLCAGQSNMQMKMQEEVTPPEEYVSDDLLRLFYVDRPEGETLYESMGWSSCKKDTVSAWPAIPYLTGIRLRKKGIAVGLVCCYQGASVIQSWMRQEYLAEPDFQIPPEALHPDHRYEEFRRWNGGTYLYETMLTKLLPFSFGTVLWYQGESNASTAEGRVYGKMLRSLIANWREDFRDAQLPFVIIQLADTEERLGEGWYSVQRAQLEAERELPFVRTVRCADVCETTMIHPITKWKLCDRIAALL